MPLLWKRLSVNRGGVWQDIQFARAKIWNPISASGVKAFTSPAKRRSIGASKLTIVVSKAAIARASRGPVIGLRSPAAFVARLGDPAVAGVAVAHEAGHLLGLTHVDDVNDVMNPVLRPGNGQTFSGAEVLQLRLAAAAARA